MYILAALGEAKSMKVYFSRVRTNAWGSLSELKNLRVKVTPSNSEYKITGPSEFPCRQHMFTYLFIGRNSTYVFSMVNVPFRNILGKLIMWGFANLSSYVVLLYQLKVGNGEDFCPRNGRLNFNDKVPNGLDTAILAIDEPFDVFEENLQHRRSPANDNMSRTKNPL
ncbi:hypothetical protein MKW98_019054 [Papaver atlanticum]|uniref:Uncharacterized protein n=1 Tax=Papaver atlanticum TaxID=357466 RepID=A0AAD4TGB5_9MAGN|nr:hypothetical protein MKW98_019054 [Papaver atlanticum]